MKITFKLKFDDTTNMQKRYLRELTKKGYIEKTYEFERLERARQEESAKFMSLFGDFAYCLTDDDINYLKRGGILGRIGEYGLLIAYDDEGKNK
jgi:hypothetical protein